MGTRSPDTPGPPAPKRGKKPTPRDASCKVQIGLGSARVVRSGVAALTPEELRFHTGRTGRQGQDLFVHIRLEHVTALVADAAAGTLTVARADEQPVVFHLGRLAVAWKKLIEDRPDLLHHLGVTPQSRLALVAIDDDALLQALAARVRPAENAGDDLDVLFAGAEHRADLTQLPALAGRVRRRGGVVWVVYPAASRAVAAGDIAAAGRAAGLVDGETVELSPGRLALKLSRL